MLGIKTRAPISACCVSKCLCVYLCFTLSCPASSRCVSHCLRRRSDCSHTLCTERLLSLIYIQRHRQSLYNYNGRKSIFVCLNDLVASFYLFSCSHLCSSPSALSSLCIYCTAHTQCNFTKVSHRRAGFRSQ